MARTGKIARLPHRIRQELNERLADGEPGNRLAKWLNDHEEVPELLERYDYDFITEQNISEWRKGGHQDWLGRQEARDWVLSMTHAAEELDEAAGSAAIFDRVARLAVHALGRRIETLAAGPLDQPEQQREFISLLQQLHQLRRSDQSSTRVRVGAERWEQEKTHTHVAWARKEVNREENEPYRRLAKMAANSAFVALFTKGMSPEEENEFRELFDLPRGRRPAASAPWLPGNPPPGPASSE